MFGNFGKTVEYRLNDSIFFISPIPPFEAIALLGDLQKLVGPAIGKGISAFGGNAGGKALVEREVNGAMLAQAFEALAQSIDGKSLQLAVRKILDPHYVAVQYERQDAVPLDEGMINTVFTANLSDMFMLVGKVLEVTYGDFFGKLIGRIGKAGVTGKK